MNFLIVVIQSLVFSVSFYLSGSLFCIIQADEFPSLFPTPFFLSLFIYLYILFSSFISTKQKTQIDFHNFDQFEQLEKSVLFCVVSFFITFFVTMLCVKHVVRVIRCRITIYNIFCLLSKWLNETITLIYF